MEVGAIEVIRRLSVSGVEFHIVLVPETILVVSLVVGWFLEKEKLV